MVDIYRTNRQFERFLFRGVPEHPETTFQRETYSYVEERITGRSLFPDGSDVYEECEEDEVIATIIYQPNSEQVKVVREDNREEITL